ncbi:hypothetical protein BN946_scf184823.g2 [Trametes cinnabarina]|uniref:Tc1-like transposase DDE domain-containing protein n=1 Tax=Pycnoporus cinnabarinus TaxID=5643 RepID=A0A060SSL9_PYCCI|nr:hypothetical protein BN946_scf184823.g2 [Trametes cinnabarina]
MLKMLFSRFLQHHRHGWIRVSADVAFMYQRGPALAKRLRAWARAFLLDRKARLPSAYGSWSKSALDNDILKAELCAHLQGIGKYIRAQDIVDYLQDPDALSRFGLKKTIALSTAKQWMKKLEYRWGKGPHGQYVNGHEREDVAAYRQKTFLPAFASREATVRQWTNGGPAVPADQATVSRHTVYWFHDESCFSANDRRKVYWVPKGAQAIPQPKGEGATLMVADFASAEYGFLKSPDGSKAARVLFRPGKNRDGWFTNDDIIQQTSTAIEILSEHYCDEDHVFVFDNATTHLKRPPTALSARRMSKSPTQPDAPLFGVEVPVIGADGKAVFGPDGKVLKEKMRMADARFADGRPQSLYFAEGHELRVAGTFKGMAEILMERGYDADAIRQLRAQCPKFECPAIPPLSPLSCCCRRLLYNEPDFAVVESILESHCKARGFGILFLPKFHCELNPIEQVWGFANGTYRDLPLSASSRSAEADLERNLNHSLDSVPLPSIRRCVSCAFLHC